MRKITLHIIFPVISACLISCQNHTLRNEEQKPGFEADAEVNYYGPRPVLIKGGSFIQGRTENLVTEPWNNVSRKTEVANFYMDETEVSNIQYREYTYWLDKVYGQSNKQVYLDALPDTTVWLKKNAFNDPYAKMYFRHPSYNDYPVVGISWLQAQQFCNWRSDRVNEQILVVQGLRKDSIPLFHFYGDSLSSQKTVIAKDSYKMYRFRLPTEAEWEYAALAYNLENEDVITGQLHPWKGKSPRKDDGKIMANFVRGRGDYMGIAGNLNDGHDITAPVYSYEPNDFGLYNMSGNVNEWTADQYIPALAENSEKEDNYLQGAADTNELPLPFYQEMRENTSGKIPSSGEQPQQGQYDEFDETYKMNSKKTDDKPQTTLITKHSRVIKGGSWADRLYWLTPGTRRYMDGRKSASTIGFRCALDVN